MNPSKHPYSPLSHLAQETREVLLVAARSLGWQVLLLVGVGIAALLGHLLAIHILLPSRPADRQRQFQEQRAPASNYPSREANQRLRPDTYFRSAALPHRMLSDR